MCCWDVSPEELMHCDTESVCVAPRAQGLTHTCVQAQRLQMKLYRQLQVSRDQRAALAARWRSWCRRRRGLDRQLASALRDLQACPTSRLPICSENRSTVALEVVCVHMHGSEMPFLARCMLQQSQATCWNVANPSYPLEI
jgi:hypothetical protein